MSAEPVQQADNAAANAAESIGRTQMLRRAEGLPSAVIDGEIILFDQNAGKYFSVGGMARFIWDILETPATFDALVTRLTETYPVGREKIEREVSPFLLSLQDARLLHID